MFRLLLIGLMIATASIESRAADFKVLIVTWRGCEEACQGFQDYLVDKGLDVEFLLRDAGGDETLLPGFRAEAREAAADLVLTWGTNVSVGVAGTLDDLADPSFNHAIPHVFMIVADPVGARLVEDLDRTGRGNVTGTFNRVPEPVNVQTIRAYDPGFDHLGVVVNPAERNSVLKRDELAALAGTLGIKFTSVELAIGPDGKPEAADMAPKLAALKEAGVDFVAVGSSSFLRENGDGFTTAAMELGLPVFSPYEDLVRNSKALIAVAARYYDIGRLAGQQAEAILAGGAVAGDLPVLRMTNFAIVINLDAARTLNLLPPIDLLQVAETVN